MLPVYWSSLRHKVREINRVFTEARFGCTIPLDARFRLPYWVNILYKDQTEQVVCLLQDTERGVIPYACIELCQSEISARGIR